MTLTLGFQESVVLWLQITSIDSVAVSGSSIFFSDIISHQGKENQNHNEIALQITSIIAGRSGVLALFGAKAFSGTHEGEWSFMARFTFYAKSKECSSWFPNVPSLFSLSGKVRARNGVNVQKSCALLKLSPIQHSSSLACAPGCIHCFAPVPTLPPGAWEWIPHGSQTYGC